MNTTKTYIIGGVIVVALIVGGILYSKRDKDGDVAGAMVSAGLAHVETVEVVMRESFPVQVGVIAAGTLPDGCAQIGNITKRQEENTFYVEIEQIRPADEDVMCTQALVPFEESVNLEAIGLLAGEYTVDVNGVLATFVLDVDNVVNYDNDKGLN